MKLSDLISSHRIIAMSHDDLMQRIRELRERRMKFIPRDTPKKKAVKKQRGSAVEKLIAGMSDDEKAKLLASLEE